MPYGWGTGGVQITAAIIGQPDTLKVIDQGADDNHQWRCRFVSSLNLSPVHKRLKKPQKREDIQISHRIPEVDLLRVKIDLGCIRKRSLSRCALLSHETETRKMHALQEAGIMAN